MKYKILMAHTPIELAEGVNKHIAMEWRPLGGVAICETGPDGINYIQALKMRVTVKDRRRRKNSFPTT